jgi:ABC-type glycerol-3-phosphate transport system substrate-binding protein
LLGEYYNYYVDIENKQAYFTDREFAEMLTSLKNFVELGYIAEGLSMQSNPGAVMRSSQQEPTERFYYKYKNSMMLQQHYNRDSGRLMIMSYAGAAAGIEADDEIAGIAADASGNVPFTSRQAYALNSNGKNKQTAWAFLKFLLSEEMQLSPSLMPLSLPLHNDARAQKAEMLLSGAFMGEQGEPLDETQQEVLRLYTEAVEQLSDQINVYTMKDSIIDDMIAAEVRYYFDGAKSAAEVAQVLQNKATLYLNE